MPEPRAAHSRRDRRQRARCPRGPVDRASESGGDRQDVRGGDDGDNQELRGPKRSLGVPRLAEARRRRIPARVVPHHDRESEAEAFDDTARSRGERLPRNARCRDESADDEHRDRSERRDRERRGQTTDGAHAGKVQRGQERDERERQEPARHGRHARPPEADVFHEERGVHRDVDEAVDPAPPADLKAPERAERASNPRDVPALVGNRGRELGHRERDREAPHERREDQQDEREAGSERRHDVFDAVGPAAHVEEDDGGERGETELTPEANHLLASAITGVSDRGRRRSGEAAPAPTLRSGARRRR